ncbi:tyrosine-type recombinase/integrase [Nonomuraea jabiensis]|uniref:Integrase n=1 Tax=Nonomuraea jabiensis TaxID=882448 RepID=A0A7W9LH10_9ACTN|nr:tyrosine-type recombinase/integrase [Nonomuraea jabiensis]MBB5783475.1 integrase [Nonomuraea jabiensis]
MDAGTVRVERQLIQITGKGLVFAGPDDGPIRNTNFNRRVWRKALQDAGVPKIHFHDLRHTGNTLAANAGASIRDLMTRMGHASTRAAIIYQHCASRCCTRLL